MNVQELKTGFWGYQKTGVYRYITDMEEEFAKRLAQVEEERKKEAEDYRRQIQRQEEELEQLRRQCDQLSQSREAIAATLLNAQQFGEDLRQQARQKAQEEELRMEARAAAQSLKLDQYDQQLEQLRQAIGAALEKMEQSVEEVSAQVKQLRQEGEECNLSLFQRKTDDQ